MAASDFITSAKNKIREGAVSANRPNSEAVNRRISGSLNALIDSDFYTIQVEHSGYFSNSTLFNSAPQIITSQSDVIGYELGISEGYTGHSLSVDVDIYDDTGALIGTLFSTDPTITAVNNGWSHLFVDVENTTTDSIGEGGASITPVTGTLTYTVLQSGWRLLPKITSSGSGSRGMVFKLKLREQ